MCPLIKVSLYIAIFETRITHIRQTIINQKSQIAWIDFTLMSLLLFSGFNTYKIIRGDVISIICRPSVSICTIIYTNWSRWLLYSERWIKIDFTKMGLFFKSFIKILFELLDQKWAYTVWIRNCTKIDTFYEVVFRFSQQFFRTWWKTAGLVLRRRFPLKCKHFTQKLPTLVPQKNCRKLIFLLF